MPKPLNILFITHESTLSGAANLLINLVQLLRQRNFCKTSIVIKRGGPQDERFKALGNAMLLKPTGYQEGKSLPFKILDFIQYKTRLRKLVRMAADCDIIFSNTIANGRLLKELSVTGKPIVVYVHELHSAMEFCNRHQDTNLSLQLGTRFFSPSRAVTLNLVQRNIPEERIYPLNYYFPFDQVQFPADTATVKQSFFTEHRIQRHNFHVVGMGAAVERKGIDLFVEVCRLVCEQTKDIHFTWIGGFMDPALQEKIESAIKYHGLSDHITITGYLPHAYEYMLPFELFLLTSREDPYPLVVLEAAYAGLPSVAFRGTGGIEEFIGNDAGYLVDHLSVSAMAQQVIELSRDKTNIQDRGAVAKSRVMEWHHSGELVIQQLRSGINGL